MTRQDPFTGQPVGFELILLAPLLLQAVVFILIATAEAGPGRGSAGDLDRLVGAKRRWAHRPLRFPRIGRLAPAARPAPQPDSVECPDVLGVLVAAKRLRPYQDHHPHDVDGRAAGRPNGA